MPTQDSHELFLVSEIKIFEIRVRSCTNRLRKLYWIGVNGADRGTCQQASGAASWEAVLRTAALLQLASAHLRPATAPYQLPRATATTTSMGTCETDRPPYGAASRSVGNAAARLLREERFAHTRLANGAASC